MMLMYSNTKILKNNYPEYPDGKCIGRATFNAKLVADHAVFDFTIGIKCKLLEGRLNKDLLKYL